MRGTLSVCQTAFCRAADLLEEVQCERQLDVKKVDEFHLLLRHILPTKWRETTRLRDGRYH